MSMFQKATKEKSKLRMVLQGPAGAGKTFSSLSIASNMGKVAVVDTESGSASKYSDMFDFDVMTITDDYNPQNLIDVIRDISGYDVLIIDSLTHFWKGPGGFLELVDREVKAMKSRGWKPDSHAAWKAVDPVYQRLIQAILNSSVHVICTARAKMDYVKEVDDKGKSSIRKVGMAPELRDGWQYEFDVEGMLNSDNELVVGKTRIHALSGRIFAKPGYDFARIVMDSLNTGAEPAPKPVVVQETPTDKALAAIASVVTMDAWKALGSKLAKSSIEVQAACEAAYNSKGEELKEVPV